MKVFSGFPAGGARSLALPASFFTELLPLIDDLAELKVTLACFRILSAKRGAIRWVTRAELRQEPGLDEATLAGGLERALARGALLQALDRASAETLYFANTERGRAAVAAIEAGAPLTSIELAKERTNIFRLYEQTVGPLTPLLADELREAELEFPAEWIEDAFREAARQNARSWAYVKKVLETRRRRSKHDEAGGRDIGREWQDFLDRRTPRDADEFPF